MSSNTKKSLDKRHRVEIEFLEALRRRCPSHEPIIEALGHMYTRVGRIEEGLAMDLELARLKPAEPENWYNLACSYSLLGQKDKAIQCVERAVHLGYSDFDWMSRDEDLRLIRDDPRFLRIIKKARA
jgi:tetratricopeptide (TPR) repeat protein